MDERVTFGPLLREMREARGWSLADLGERVFYHRGYVGKVEQGQRMPDRGFAEKAEDALGAGGLLLAAWETDDRARREAAEVGRLLLASTRDSLHMTAISEESVDLSDLDDATRALAVEYLGAPPGPMLKRAYELRSEAYQRLRTRDYRPSELRDLYVILGRLQGVLAYAALDLGDGGAAATHAEAGWRCADLAGDGELSAWTRGTQALIARFDSDFAASAWFARDGLRRGGAGTARVRLLCGLAQSQAGLGDAAGTRAGLDQALLERERGTRPDAVGGLFTFSETKQHYYSASSLIWLDDERDARRAVAEAVTAVNLWESGPPEDRSLDDEALARVYQATAHVHLGEVDAASSALRPVLDLPEDRQISWIRKRMARVADGLSAPLFKGSREAAELIEELRAA